MEGKLKPLPRPDATKEAAKNGWLTMKDENMAKHYPLTLEFLCRRSWSKDQPRQTGTLLIFVEDGLFKICVSDRDSEHVAFVSAETLQAALGQVEEGLATNKLDWRLTRSALAKKRK